jgi:hypothetical protein
MDWKRQSSFCSTLAIERTSERHRGGARVIRPESPALPCSELTLKTRTYCMQTLFNRVLQMKRRQMAQTESSIAADLLISGTPADSQPFILRSNPPFPNYPAPAAAASVILAITPNAGMLMVIQKLAVVHIGGGFVDGSGNIVWRVLQNGAPVKGLGNLQAQVGTLAQPNDLVLLAMPGDILQITVEVPAGQAAMPGGTSTAAAVHGFQYPVARANRRYAG